VTAMPQMTASTTDADAAAPMIFMEHVEKWYGQYKALTDINLSVRTGEKIVLCGPSGSGKSTLIRCINHLEPYSKGRILVGGKVLGDDTKTIGAVRRDVGMVFQQFNLFPHLTAAENVMLAPKIVNKVQPVEAKELAAEMLAKVGLSDKGGNYPSQLSGGQQQRVAIARALAMRPNVLLCDEITSALDPELVNEVLRVVENLAKEGITLILVTHEMRFARDVGTKLVFMHLGKVHEEGAPKELFANPKTPELANFVGSVH